MDRCPSGFPPKADKKEVVLLARHRRENDMVINGQVSEWFKEVVLKTTDGVSYPGVRIPPCPILFLKLQTSWSFSRSNVSSDRIWWVNHSNPIIERALENTKQKLTPLTKPIKQAYLDKVQVTFIII